MKRIYIAKKLDGNYGIDPLGRGDFSGPKIQLYDNLDDLVMGVAEISKKRKLVVEISHRCSEEDAQEIYSNITAKNLSHVVDIVYRENSLLKKEDLAA